MRQRNEVEGATIAAHPECAPDDFIQFGERNKLRDRQFADWNNKTWSQEIDLVIHPRRAIPNFIGRRDPIATRGRFARETAADGSKINLRPHLDLSQMTKFFEPTKERAACRPCEWLPEDRLLHAGRLAD